MNRRDIIFGLLDGKTPQQYVPAAFFCHFDPSCHQGIAAIEKHREFFQFTGMDFVKIQYERTFPSQSIERPSDWANVPLLGKDFFEPQIEVVRGLVNALKSEAPVVVTLYSPFMCAAKVGGDQSLVKHLQEDPEPVKRGLEIVTESLLTFVKECIRAGVDGFYHSTQGGESRRFQDRSIFVNYVKPYDLELMNECNRDCPFNILHICDYRKDTVGGYDDLTPFLDYPGQVVNCSLDVGDKTLTSTEVSQLIGRPFLGGMDRNGALATGNPEQVREEAREVLRSASGGFMLGADCTIPNARWENLRAAIDEAHHRADN